MYLGVGLRFCVDGSGFSRFLGLFLFIFFLRGGGGVGGVVGLIGWRAGRQCLARIYVVRLGVSDSPKVGTRA